MRRKGFSVLLISLFLILVPYLAEIRTLVKGSPEILYVPNDFPTIQAAIGNASSGAEIHVASGLYIENFNISKSLSIIGEDRDTTIIDGLGAQYAILIRADDVTLESLTVTKSGSADFGAAIHVDRRRGIEVNNTRIMDTYFGLSLLYCAYSVFSNNFFNNNTIGVSLVYSNDNVFTNNVISAFREGTFVYYSNNNGFFGNTLSGNSSASISLLSNRNYFYHNNFNDPVAIESGSTNFWSRGNEGNYWADYNFSGMDANGDGIGDEPKYIDDYNTDEYPLMGRFSELNVNFKEQRYYITIVSNSSVSNIKFEIGKETGNKILAFAANGEDNTTGFCRIAIPLSLMGYPFTVTDLEGEIAASLLDLSNETSAYLYFTYPNGDQSITVITSKALQLYYELLEDYAKLQGNLANLNATYSDLLANFNLALQANISIITASYESLLNSFDLLLENLSQLQKDFLAVNNSLQENLSQQSEYTQNMHNLIYILAATTTAFLITTVYFSTHLHSLRKRKTSVPEES